MSKTTGGSGRLTSPRYDYLLFGGPGRSATTYVYQALQGHYAVLFPEIKEAHYYRNPRRYQRARRTIPSDRLLGDVSNDAYLDPCLTNALANLRTVGQRVLLVIVLRDHLARACSMVRFDESRGRALRPGGSRALLRRVVERRLTPERLDSLFGMAADVAVLDFDVLTAKPTGALNALASLCGISPTATRLPEARINESERARSALLAAAAALTARALREAGFRRTLQRLKDSRRIHGLIFRPASDEYAAAADTAFSQEQIDMLLSANSGCWEVIRRHTVIEKDGLYVGPNATLEPVTE